MKFLYEAQNQRTVFWRKINDLRTVASYISAQIWIHAITICGEHCNKPCSVQVMEDKIQKETTNLSWQEVHYVSRNIFRRCVTCSEAGGHHFETPAWNKVSWTVYEKWTINFWQM